MAKITVEEGQLMINFEGLRKMGTLKNKLLIPLENVEWAMIDLEAWNKTPKPFQKIAGIDSYGIYFGGTFKQNGKKIFYDLGKKDFAVVIKLKNAKYDRLIIGVDEPKKIVNLINGSLNNNKYDQNELNK